MLYSLQRHLGSFRKISSCRKQDVCRRVESRFRRVLKDADDEADADDLHGNVIGDAEEAAGHGNEEQGSSGNAGSTAGTDSRQDAEQEGRRKIYGNAQSVDGCQGHNRNGNGRTGHVDRRPEGNGDRIRIRVDAEFFSQGHVDRDVSRRTACKEGCHTAGRDTLPNERIGISAKLGIDDDRIDDEGKDEHRPDQEGQELSVADDGFNAVGRNGIGDEAHDAEGRQADDPLDTGRDRISTIVEDGFRRFGNAASGDAEEDSPAEDTDVVAVIKAWTGLSTIFLRSVVRTSAMPSGALFVAADTSSCSVSGNT